MSEVSEPKKAGRPPLEEARKIRTIRVEDDLWEWCQSQPDGAAAYLRRLAGRDRKRRERREGD